MTEHNLPVLERIWRRCLGTEDRHGCWIWTGALRNQYGVVRVRRDGKESTRNVHRVVYAEMHKTVPKGISVTHTCGRKLCCNPRHLQLKVQPLDLKVSDSVEL